jgi:phosphotriesterase-related protein
LAELFVADIAEGIDVHDYGGPLVRRTTHHAGVIKIAAERTFTARDDKVFAAAAQAHRQTGCPILTHTEEGEGAMAQVERLRGLGVDLRHVCLSHTDRKSDVGLHRALLAMGGRVEFDSAFRWKAGERNGTRELLLALLPEFPDQIMVGMDAERRSYWRSFGGGPGLSFLLTDFSAQLRAAGVSPSLLERFLCPPLRSRSLLPHHEKTQSRRPQFRPHAHGRFVAQMPRAPGRRDRRDL